MDNIKKCPFCNSEAILLKTKKLINDLYWIRCTAECCEQIGFFNQGMAINNWNKRARMLNDGTVLSKDDKEAS